MTEATLLAAPKLTPEEEEKLYVVVCVTSTPRAKLNHLPLPSLSKKEKGLKKDKAPGTKKKKEEVKKDKDKEKDKPKVDGKLADGTTPPTPMTPNTPTLNPNIPPVFGTSAPTTAFVVSLCGSI